MQNRFSPALVGLKTQREKRAIAIASSSTSLGRAAVNYSVRVEGDRSIRGEAVSSAQEGMNDRFHPIPTRRPAKLEYCPPAVRSAPPCRSEDISCFIQSRSSKGYFPITNKGTSKTVQNAFVPLTARIGR